jgi:hypothetical protein
LLQPLSACWALESRRARPRHSDAADAAGWKATSTTPLALTASMAADTSAAVRCVIVATGCRSTTWGPRVASLRCRILAVTPAPRAAVIMARGNCLRPKALPSRLRCLLRLRHNRLPLVPACKPGRRTTRLCPFSQRATSRCTIPAMLQCPEWVVEGLRRCSLSRQRRKLEHRDPAAGAGTEMVSPRNSETAGCPLLSRALGDRG